MTAAADFFDAIDRDDGAALDQLLASHSELASSRDDDGASAVMHAMYRGRRAMAERLAGALPELDVFEAATLGRADRVRELLAADPTLASAISPDGFTALHYPGFFGGAGAADVAQLLLEAGSNPSARSDNDFWVMPLHSAASGAHAGIVELLLAAGADPNALQRHGWTPIHAAAQNGDIRSLEALLGAGADPSLRNEEGHSAADIARAAGHDELASRLG
ncbi:MAG TPA: ankyrin repeat domain-containing protein [Candidatus Limnocylindrales bacterium]|nr:ankyrin repeat domain-containing protein [Candidatus Limnocylindrales bacterium]